MADSESKGLVVLGTIGCGLALCSLRVHLFSHFCFPYFWPVLLYVFLSLLFSYSAIKGHEVSILTATKSGFVPGPLEVKDKVTRHVVFTAETHNFPTGMLSGSVLSSLSQ